MYRILRLLLSLAVITSVAGPAIADSDDDDDDGGGPGTRTIEVNCDAGRTISRALSRAKPGHTILVSGVCRETITIMIDKLTIQGDPSAVIDGQGAEEPVVFVDGAVNVTLRSLTVQNGLDGIAARRQADVTLENLTVRDNADEGIELNENSTARISDCTTENNGDEGLLVVHNSSALIFDGPFSSNGNAGRGMQISLTSSASVFGVSVEVTGNGNDGIGVFGASRLVVSNGGTVLSEDNEDGVAVGGSAALFVSDDSALTIKENSGDGLQVTDNSDAIVGGTTTISGNGSQGILTFESSSLSLRGTTRIEGNGASEGNVLGALQVSRSSNASLRGTLEIRNNASFGLFVLQGSHSFFEGGILTVDGNGSHGVFVFRNAQLELRELNSPVLVQVTNNGGHGVLLDQQSSARMSISVALADNAFDGLHCLLNSSVVVSGTAMINNGDDGIDIDDCSANVFDSSINGNAGSAVEATFGSRLTLNDNTIVGPIFCDGTVLSRGSAVCP